MKCPKCGNDMGNSIYCDNCKIYPFKDKEPIQLKKNLKIFGVALSCCVLIAVLSVIIVEIADNDVSNERNISDNVSTEENDVINNEYDNDTMADDTEPQYDESIQIENGIAYFDMTPAEFVEKYNQTLTTEAEYVANCLSNPTYQLSATGVQKTTIRQYDVSNNITAIHTFIHTDENDKIMEAVTAVETQFNQPKVDLSTVLVECVSKVATVLTDLTFNEYEDLALGLADRVKNGERATNYYKGVMLDMYNNDYATYFRISCMPEDVYYADNAN